MLQKCVDSFIALTYLFPDFATKIWFNILYLVSKISFNGGINADMGVQMTGKLCLLALCLLLLLPAAALAAPAAEVWVDGVKVSEAGAAMPAGVAYDAATGTLTLTDAVLTHPRLWAGDALGAVIYADGDLNITLAGNSSIVAGEGTVATYGIYLMGSVTFEGDGSLSVRAEGSGESHGISVQTSDAAALTLNSGTLDIYGKSAGVSFIRSDIASILLNGGKATFSSAVRNYSANPCNVAPTYDEARFFVTAVNSYSGQPQAYDPANLTGGVYRSVTFDCPPPSYDEYGFADGGLFQPAVKAADGVYEIGNAGQLFWFSQQTAATGGEALNARLTKDITVPAGKVFTPIGGSQGGSVYTGTFDGQGHVIDGLRIASTQSFALSYTGLVGKLGQGGVIRNVRLKNLSTDYAYATSAWNVGAVCSENNGTIENCVVESASVVAGYTAGGICGQNNGTIRLCRSAADVTASGNTAGGVCGQNNGTIENCLNTGSISAGWAAGGICGQNASGATVSGCLSLGGYASTLPGYAGGISGINYALPVNSCYLASTQGYDGARTQAQMLSGEVTWLLNGSQSAGAWGQTLDGSSMPELGGKAVYRGYTSCDGTIGYANTALSQDVPAHRFVYHQSTGGHMQVCSVCGLPSFVIEPHVLDWTMDADGHSALCALCGYTVPRAAHAMDWTADETGHSGVCTVCGYTAAHAAHTMNWTANEDGHSGVCAVCGYEAAHAAHVYGDGGICEVCGYVRPVLPPKTGDGAHPGAWLVLMLASGAIALTALRRRRRA